MAWLRYCNLSAHMRNLHSQYLTLVLCLKKERNDAVDNGVWSEWQTWAAVYAAIVATAALALEVRRWFESGVRLRIHLMTNAGYIENGKFSDERQMLVTVSNRGDRPTTITHLALVEYSGRWRWWRRLRSSPTKQAFIPDPRPSTLYPQALPCVLDPGKQWTGFTDWLAIKSWAKESGGTLYVALVSSDA